ncbi:hypothetical protein KHA80_17605 [Anaerobacillus sp. HL2]|nr:hypothetical protein KHA80_17605 [Anaerobacillus sp. HL2]
MIAKAKSGIYTRQEVDGVPYDDLTKFFKLGQGENAGLFKVKSFYKRKSYLNRLI